MRTSLLFCSLLMFVGHSFPGFSQDAQVDVGSEDAAPETNPDFLLIRAAVEKYTELFNSGKAEEMGMLFTEGAELIDTSGTAYRGRDVIQGEYQAFFKVHPEASVRIVVNKIAFVAPNVAIEEGEVESHISLDSPPSYSRYVSVYAKVGEGWLLSHVRDAEVPRAPGAELEELSWLIGEWVDEAPDSLMKIDCYWHESGSYLIRDFEIKIEGLLASKGTERIGWDPLQKKVRSWLFDSEGGFLEGTWVRKGNQWTIATHGFRPDGVPTHATYTVTPLRDDAYHLSATSRTAGESELDDFEMTVVHRPPSPGDIPAVETAGTKPSVPEKAAE